MGDAEAPPTPHRIGLGPTGSPGLLARAPRPHVHVALLLDLDLLLADLARDPLRVLDHPLADLDLLLHHRLLAHADLLLADRDADLLALADGPGGGPAVHRRPLDDDLFPL